MKYLIILLLFVSQFVQAQNIKNQQNISYALINLDTREFISSNNEQHTRPMASITKVMSAIVTLNANLDLDEIITVTGGTERSTRIRKGMKLTRSSLIELALVSSDNLAARTLAETWPEGYSSFIDKMNETATVMGMSQTNFSDATGLMSTNVSSANDIIMMMSAVGPWPIFNDAANKIRTVTTAFIPTKKGEKRVEIVAGNTNNFVGKLDILAAKTGYTSRAGRCLAMTFTQNGSNYLLVVMGAATAAQRTQIVQKLIDSVR